MIAISERIAEHIEFLEQGESSNMNIAENWPAINMPIICFGKNIRANMVARLNYSFWELAIDGIMTVTRKIGDQSPG